MADNVETASAREFTCGRDGLVFRKGGGFVGTVERLFGGEVNWCWHTSIREHSGSARTKRDAIEALITAWENEGA